MHLFLAFSDALGIARFEYHYPQDSFHYPQDSFYYQQDNFYYQQDNFSAHIREFLLQTL